MNDVKDIVGQIEQLEPVPTIAGQLLARAGDPDVSLTEIADLYPFRGYEPSHTPLI